MNGFAQKTDVPIEKTKAEIETVLRRYKADQFVSGWNETAAFVMFRCRDWYIRFQVKVPNRNDRKFTHTDKGKIRVIGQQEAEYEQATRSIWRRLLLCIRAKLESVQSGIETFEEAFLAHIVVPGGGTVGDWAATALPEARKSGKMPQGLLALTAGSGGAS